MEREARELGAVGGRNEVTLEPDGGSPSAERLIAPEAELSSGGKRDALDQHDPSGVDPERTNGLAARRAEGSGPLSNGAVPAARNRPPVTGPSSHLE